MDPHISTSRTTRRNGVASIVALAVIAGLLAIEQRARVWGFLPWLLLLACPVVHVFAHGGHRHGHAHAQGAHAEPMPPRERGERES